MKKKKSNNEVVVIRRLLKTDFGQLQKYINDLSREKTFVVPQDKKLTVQKTKEYIDTILKNIKQKKELVLLLFVGGNLVGMANINLRKKVYSHIGNFTIAILAKYRNKGFGSLLTREIFKEAKNLPDLKVIVLQVHSSNKDAILLYKKFGLKKYGLLPKGITHNHKYVDELLMYKKIR